jgi:hypothetical protein
MLGPPRLRLPPLATVPATCLAVSWRIKEVGPQLLRPHLPRKISSSHLSIPCNNLLLEHKARLSHSKVHLVAISLALRSTVTDHPLLHRHLLPAKDGLTGRLRDPRRRNRTTRERIRIPEHHRKSRVQHRLVSK